MARGKELTETLRIRLAPAERLEVKRAAQIVGLDVADWVRSELRRAAIREIMSTGEKPNL